MAQPDSIDHIHLNFGTGALWVLNVCLAVIMFGVALGLRPADFAALWRQPRAALVGIFSQFILLPALTFGLVWWWEPQPSLALGMMLVAACPGGNVSNFFSQWAGGNAALSVSLTAFATAFALIFTPLNLQIWGSLYPPTANLLTSVALSPFRVFETVVLILGLPLLGGMYFRHRWPARALRLQKFLRPLSLLIFAAFILVAFARNTDIFVGYVPYIFWLVLVHNALALLAGYGSGRIAALPDADCRSLAIETGIQNSGLALLLIFNFFDGLGGMALLAGWWGIWHLLSGFAVAGSWRRWGHRT